jgi:phosphoribosylformimino-5-aminoimidazole carboxamide ribotide isomerase
MDIIPAIDLLGGKAVRLRQGRYDEVTTYADPPAEVARRWAGLVPVLHVVDLEGAREGHPVQLEAIRDVIASFGSGVEIGGGIRSFEAAQAYFDLGAARVVLGTAAIRDPALVRSIAVAHPQQVVLAVDAKNGRVATDGWLDVSERTAIDLVLELRDAPLAAVLYTDIERDGTEVGPNVTETARLAQRTGTPVIASGGVGTLEHLQALAEASPAGIIAAIVGRALHEGRFTLEEAVRAVQSREK